MFGRIKIESDLKKYQKLNGYTYKADMSRSVVGAGCVHLSKRFGFAEHELKRALRTNKIRMVFLGEERNQKTV